MQQVQQQFEKELIGGNNNLLNILFLLIVIEKNNKMTKIKGMKDKSKKNSCNYENQLTDMIAEGST